MLAPEFPTGRCTWIKGVSKEFDPINPFEKKKFGSLCVQKTEHLLKYCAQVRIIYQWYKLSLSGIHHNKKCKLDRRN